MLSDSDVLEVDEDRASLLHAAANARSVAMLTGTHGVVSLPIDRPRVRLPSPAELSPPGAVPEEREGDDATTSRLRARVAVTSAGTDSVAELRSRIELARARLAAGDEKGARKEAAAAAGVVGHAPAAHAMLRALLAGRANLDEQLGHVRHLHGHAVDDRARADWLVERGRLLEARSGNAADAVPSYVEALALVADHPGALYGLEAALDATERWEELAAHLARLSAIAEDKKLAAWLEVERALVLDRRLDDHDGARAALARALELDPVIGPVRDAVVDHAVLHRDDGRLGELLEREAAIESENGRAARLELDAALARLRAGADPAHVLALLERAHGRAPTTPLVDARIGEELARLHDAMGRHADALRVRKSVLRHVEDPREQHVTLRAIAADAERVGALDEAISALESARATAPEDETLLADLDRVLTAAGKQDTRAALWMREANHADDPTRKARALLLSAQAAKAGGRDAEAARQLQAAWIAAPSAPGVYDAMAERLQAPGAKDAVAARVALYEQAVRTTKDPDKKIYFLEKIAWLWDDVAGDAASAVRAYEDVLAIEPARMSAISGLASAATRANDDNALARALLAEAEVTADPAWRAEVQLRAAEALADIDRERALALAESLRADAPVSARAAELVTKLHAAAGRWDLVVQTQVERAESAPATGSKIALLLAAADVLSSRLRAPERAIEVLEKARAIAPDDPAVSRSLLDAFEALGDGTRLREAIERIADGTSSPRRRAALFLRAAELDESEGKDERAVAMYLRARDATTEEPLVVERLRRLGARAKVPADVVPPLARAVRVLERSADAGEGAEPLLASGARDVATLRTAERFARRMKSAPLLANALAMQADAVTGKMAQRTLEGLAKLVAWTLPESDDLEPWERLVALGSDDVAVLDTLVRRAWPKVREGEMHAVELATVATKRRIGRASDDTEKLALLLDHVRLLRTAGRARDAAEQCKRALGIDVAAFSLAAHLAELATELVDRGLAIVAAKSLAALTMDPKARAEILRDAADLALAEGDRPLGAELLVKALDADPDAVLVAARLAELHGSLGNWYELARTLRRALRAAKTKDAIIPMASELADVARNRVKDPMLAIEALSRAREVAPDHVPTLFVLSELYIGQRSWQEALVALNDVVKATLEPAEKLVALVGRASIYRRVLERPADAERELRAALEIDPHDARAIRGLLDLGTTIPMEERAALLSRLVVADGAPDERRRALLELAETRRALADLDGAEGALVEAAALSPDAAMFDRLRALAGKDQAALARVLTRALARARESGRAPGVAWYLELGKVELDLDRADAAIEHFEEALRLDATRDEARLALARALAKRGRHETAAAALAPLLDAPARPTPLDATFVRLLETSLAGAGRQQQAWIARELRAIAGDIDATARAELDSRRSIPPGTAMETLPASSLRSFVMPGGLGRHPLWDVAPIAMAYGGKIARVALANQGVSSRDRIKPKAVSALRQLFDRMARAFEIVEIELAASDSVVAPVIAVEDQPWIVVPSSMADWAEPWAIAALARPFTRIALGVPWLGAIGAAETLAILVAFARQVVPAFGATPIERIEPLVGDYELRAKRAIDRRRRRFLEEMEHPLSIAPAVAEDTFADAIARTEARAAFLLSGSLRAALDTLGVDDGPLGDALRVPGPRALQAVLGRPLPRDVVSFALSGEATALRRSLGTIS